jgi:hypothetical protein
LSSDPLAYEMTEIVLKIRTDFFKNQQNGEVGILVITVAFREIFIKLDSDIGKSS